MDDLDKFITSRKKKSIIFSRNFAKGYEQFKIGVIPLRNDAQAVGGYGKNSVPGGLTSMNEMSHETRPTRR